MDKPPRLKIRPPLLRITQLCIAIAALCGVLIVGYSLISANHLLDDSKEELRCRNTALVTLNQSNSAALSTILYGLANLDNSEELDRLKEQVPDLISKMNRASSGLELALKHCGD